MKKFFIPIFVLFSFIFINNVGATGNPITFDYDGTYAVDFATDDKIKVANYIIEYMTTNYPDSRYLITTYSDYNTSLSNYDEDKVFLIFLVPESERGSYFITSQSRTDNYSYDFRLNYTDSLEGVSQDGYLTQANNLKYYTGNANMYCLKTDTKEQCFNRLSYIDTSSYTTTRYLLLNDLGSYLNGSVYQQNIYSLCKNSSNCSYS